MAQINYIPNPATEDPSPGGMRCVGGSCSGNGAPNNIFGFPGYTYTDIDTGDMYLFYNDTWNLFSGGGGGGTVDTFSGAGSPEGVQVGSPGNTYWDTTNSAFYVKHSGNNTNTGWALLVG